MIQIHKHDKGELYSIYGFFIDPDKDVWVDKKQLMELYNEIKKIKDKEEYLWHGYVLIVLVQNLYLKQSLTKLYIAGETIMVLANL